MKPSKPKLHSVSSDPAAAPIAPADAKDLDSLWLDAGLDDALVATSYHVVPIGKPKDFFRTAPGSHRRRAVVYVHKQEGVIDTSFYIIDKPMWGLIENARHCLLVTVVYRDGAVRLWPIPYPAPGEQDNAAWISARAAAKAGVNRWVKIVWQRGAYQTRDAQEGYAPDPDFSKLPPLDELRDLAFGEAGIVRDKNHSVYQHQIGAKPSSPDPDSDDVEL